VLSAVLPCAKEKPAAREYEFVIQGHECLQYTVEADEDVTVCLIPNSAWHSRGKEAVMKNPYFCKCRGVKTCTLASHEMYKSVPYLLHVEPTHGKTADIKVMLKEDCAPSKSTAGGYFCTIPPNSIYACTFF
jgi:hypothetical protein